MKTTLWLKRIDFYIQLSALIIPVILSVYYCEVFFLVGIYFSVGAVQLMSLIINKIFLSKFLKDSTRIYCERIVWLALAILVVVLLIAEFDLYRPAFMIDPITEGYIIFLLFGTPLLSGWYYIISYTELQRIRKLSKRVLYI